MLTQTVHGADGAPITIHTDGSGPGVVVIHGAGVSVRDYRRLSDRLATHLTVHRYNRRGHPDSAPLTGAETAQTDIDDLAAVLSHTGARFLFGHSGGGFVAIRAGLTLPVDRIATFDAAVALDGVDFPRGFLDPFEEAVARGELVEAFMQAGQIHPDSPSAKAPRRVQRLGVRAFLHSPPGKQMVELLPTIGPEVRRIVEHEAPACAYSAITAPTLLTYGSRSSQYFKDICHHLVRALPNARELEIPKASHNTANTAPPRLTDPLLEFFTTER